MSLTLVEPAPVEESRRPLRGPAPRRVVLAQLATFTAIGVAMTAAYLGLYVALTGTLGMQAANVVAWVLTALADTSANRRLTFGIRGTTGAARAQAESLVVFAVGMAVTSGSLLVLGWLTASPGEVAQLVVLVAANIAAGLLRFVLLRRWVFATGRAPGQPSRWPAKKSARRAAAFGLMPTSSISRERTATREERANISDS